MPLPDISRTVFTRMAYTVLMFKLLRNYLSCFGSQFIKGIGILADKAKYKRSAFLKSIRPLPNFFELSQQASPNTSEARRVRGIVWGAIAVAWIAMIILLFVISLPFALWLALAVIVSLIAPHTLLLIAAASLRRS